MYNAIPSIKTPKTSPVSACKAQGDEPEVETDIGIGSPVVDGVRFVVFAMLIEQRLRRRYRFLRLKFEDGRPKD